MALDTLHSSTRSHSEGTVKQARSAGAAACGSHGAREHLRARDRLGLRTRNPPEEGRRTTSICTRSEAGRGVVFPNPFACREAAG